MLIDSHIHVGQFNNLYFAPSVISSLMEQLDVDYYAVSSTTQCEENYPKVLSEIEELIRFDGNKVLPIMWITPESLKGNIAWFIESDIQWKMIKIHPFLHKTEWMPGKGMIEEVVEIAKELHIPLLIHTGNEECCKSGLFESTISTNPTVDFILAHGRPLHEALSMVQMYNNVYADSAFMTVEDMKAFLDVGLTHKLLWGTDMCIPRHFYPNEDMVEYYTKKLNAFRQICCQEAFNQVTYNNAVKLFGLT